MTAFISHSFENKPEFQNVADALQQQHVPYWDPAEIRTGSNLRDQLRQAVDRCSLCIFVASKKSIESSWCGAELGAFWGAGKPILVYLAEASLPDEALPQIVQGDVWERRLLKIADRAREITAQADPSGPTRTRAGSSVANLTVEQLEKMIQGAMSLAAATITAKSSAQTANIAEVAAAAKNAASKVLVGFQASEVTEQHQHDDWQTRILWVDDRPQNNIYARQAMETMGLQFTLALSTDEAMDALASQQFAAIISDMGRREGPREGYKLLEAVRRTDKTTPYFIFAGSNSDEHRREAIMRGAQGSTNIANDLVEMVVRALPTGGRGLS